MNFIKFNLLLTSILVIILYFTIPFYNTWLYGDKTSKVINPNNDMFSQAQNLDVAYRREYRFGTSYRAFMDMKSKLDQYKGVTLLLPNNDYLRAMKINDLDMAEPAVFYYFTGINAVWANSPKADSANWVITLSKRTGINLMKIRSKPQLDSIITLYKQYIKQ